MAYYPILLEDFYKTTSSCSIQIDERCNPQYASSESAGVHRSELDHKKRKPMRSEISGEIEGMKEK